MLEAVFITHLINKVFETDYYFGIWDLSSVCSGYWVPVWPLFTDSSCLPYTKECSKHSWARHHKGCSYFSQGAVLLKLSGFFIHLLVVSIYCNTVPWMCVDYEWSEKLVELILKTVLISIENVSIQLNCCPYLSFFFEIMSEEPPPKTN